MTWFRVLLKIQEPPLAEMSASDAMRRLQKAAGAEAVMALADGVAAEVACSGDGVGRATCRVCLLFGHCLSSRMLQELQEPN